MRYAYATRASGTEGNSSVPLLYSQNVYFYGIFMIDCNLAMA